MINKIFSRRIIGEAVNLARPMRIVIIMLFSWCSCNSFAGPVTGHQKSVLNGELALLQQRINTLNSSDIAQTALTTINARDLPWIDSGIVAKKGQSITFMLNGGLNFGHFHVQPGTAFWVGFGQKKPMYITGSNTGTVTVPVSGPVYFARALAEWKDPQGELFTPVEHYQAVKGAIQILSVVWRNDPKIAMHKMLDNGINHPLFTTEAQRLKSPTVLPEGWKNLWMFGDNGIFQSANKGKQINVFTHKNVGILQKDVSFPLVKDSRIDWQWMIETLPSVKPEDAAHTHDYLSIAVEFDDGQDLTYMWSSSLPEGKHFRCPLPRWDLIETHMVIHNDAALLGKWLNESRNIYADYHKMIGGDAKKITRIWFIANSLFQGGFGTGAFKNINLYNDNKAVSVL